MTDVQQIEALQAMWAQFHGEKSVRAWSELFIEDATYTNRKGQVSRGRAQIADDIQARFDQHNDERYTLHLFGPSAITINGDAAEARAAYVAYERHGDEPWISMGPGVCLNALVRREGRWLYTEVRNCNVGEQR